MPNQDADDYESMSVEELDQVIIDLSNERQSVLDRARAATAAYDRRRGAARAEELAATLSDPEKAALMQHLTADPVVSGGATGEPGTEA